jgi:hypothetical protein
MSTPDHEPVAELVMPFVAVASNGGLFDDQAYTAGYEMGLLDALLGHSYSYGQQARTLRAENRAQADLLAMRHGWAVAFTELPDGWVSAVFTRTRNVLERGLT